MALFSSSRKSELQKSLAKLHRIHPSDRYPTYVFVVASDVERDTELALVEKHDKAKTLLSEGYLKVATKEDVFKIRAETDGNVPVGKVAMRSDVIHFGAGKLYQRHINPDDPTYFPFEFWAKEMEPLAAVTIFAVLNQLGVQEATFTTKAGLSAVHSIRAQVAAGPENKIVKAGLAGTRKGNSKGDQTYTVSRPKPRRPVQIPEQHMFWMQYARTLEGGSLLEVAKQIVEGQVPNSFTCKIDLLSAKSGETTGGVAAKFLTLAGSASRGTTSTSYVEISATFWQPEEYCITAKDWGWDPLLSIRVKDPPPVLETCKKILQDPKHMVLEAATFASKTASRSLGRDGLSGAIAKTAMDAIVNGFFNFAVRISVVGLRGAGKTTFVNSLRMVLAESVYGTGLGMVQNMKFRSGKGGAKADGTATTTYDLYKVADIPFVVGDDEYMGGLCFMDTAGITDVTSALEISGSIAKQVEGRLKRLSQRIRGGEEEHQNADAMLVVVDAEDLYEKVGDQSAQGVAKYLLETGLVPLVDSVLQVDPAQPIHVLLTKIDAVQDLFSGNERAFLEAKQNLEAAAETAFPNKLCGVHFMHSFTWPAPTVEYSTLVNDVINAPSEQAFEKAKAAYAKQIEEWTGRHRDHLRIMQLILESITKK